MSFDWTSRERVVEKTFALLRKSGFQLGMEEYLSGLALVSEYAEGLPLVQNPDGLKQALKMIWCSSRSEQGQFEPIWQKAVEATESERAVIVEVDESEPLPLPPEPDFALPPRTPPPPPAAAIEKTDASALEPMAQPVKSPFSPAEVDRPLDLQRYWPVSRRSMSYSWRYLRRPGSEGPADIVDVAATVQRTAQQGFYLCPVMQQRSYNRAQLVLFIDQNGSMMPLHQFTREVVNTALYESDLPEGQVTVCYFHNAPAEYVYLDRFLKEPVMLAAVLAACDEDTSVVVVSDAGACRGYRQLDRIRATTGFLRQLRQATSLYAWLNPVPMKRWVGSSAEMIARLVPMFQMDDDGLSDAIDVVRGLRGQCL